ncbi:MAG: M20/M25/M40 family metallo-hydrolase [Bacteroidetes bacterium]|nr:M20/M25/M40 family metallo-hydrolase [Bacteroidota bacterium]
MKKLLLAFCILFCSAFVHAQNTDSLMIRKIYSEILLNGMAHSWLRDLSVNVGARLTGSQEAEKAVQVTEIMMKNAGADSVWLQPVMVPHWVRGAKESAKIIEANKHEQEVPVTALGGSVSTPAEGITANIIEVKTFDELEKLGREKIQGKIVFYNHPFDETLINTFEAYGEAAEYRWSGPSEAARYGAIASVCRSMTNASDDFPHTGAMGYNDSLPKIPCAAISTNAADLLSRILRSNAETKFFLKLNSQMLDSVLSHNVVGEIRGSEHPEEIIVIGGHLDSWDTGKGAHDDGAGVVQAIEIIRAMKALGIKPKRTIRAVAFMNEENGLRGGKKYAELAGKNTEKHIAAMESDAGGFTPYGFGFDMSDEKRAIVKKWTPLFRPYLLWNFDETHGGSDIGPLKRELKVPLIGLVVDSQRYFDYHHAASDTFDKVNKRELLLGAAAMASMAYLLSTYGL